MRQLIFGPKSDLRSWGADFQPRKADLIQGRLISVLEGPILNLKGLISDLRGSILGLRGLD